MVAGMSVRRKFRARSHSQEIQADRAIAQERNSSDVTRSSNYSSFWYLIGESFG